MIGFEMKKHSFGQTTFYAAYNISIKRYDE